MNDFSRPQRPHANQNISRFPSGPGGGPPPMFNLAPGVKNADPGAGGNPPGAAPDADAAGSTTDRYAGYFPHRYWLLLHGHWAGPLFLAVVTPLTYMFLHANWLHLGMNVMSLAAFGTVVERLVGTRMMVWLFIICGVAGAFAEFAIDPSADTVIIGASAGISGLFAIAFLTMIRAQNMPRRKLVGAIILIIMTMIVMGKVGMMGMNVAWMSHVGGFSGGAGGRCLHQPARRQHAAARSWLVCRDHYLTVTGAGWKCLEIFLAQRKSRPFLHEACF